MAEHPNKGCPATITHGLVLRPAVRADNGHVVPATVGPEGTAAAPAAVSLSVRTRPTRGPNLGRHGIHLLSIRKSRNASTEASDSRGSDTATPGDRRHIQLLSSYPCRKDTGSWERRHTPDTMDREDPGAYASTPTPTGESWSYTTLRGLGVIPS